MLFLKKLIILISLGFYIVNCNKCCNKTILKNYHEKLITDFINDFKLKFPDDSSFTVCSTEKSLNNLIKCELIRIKLDLNGFWLINTNQTSKVIL